MLPNTIQCVYFDAVGTLLLPKESVMEVYWQTGRKYGSQKTLDQVRTSFFPLFHLQESFDQQNSWQTSEVRERDRWQQIIRGIFDDIDTDDCFQELWDYFAAPEHWKLDEDTQNVFDFCAQRGLRVGIASNFDERLFRICGHFPELLACEERICSSSRLGIRKPAPQFFDFIQNQVGLNRNQIAYVGDDFFNDYAPSHEAGFFAVLKTDQRQSEFRTIARLLELVETE
ncbi:MAG: HAD-IA family hydrolase [Zavarzinella sp.]